MKEKGLRTPRLFHEATRPLLKKPAAAPFLAQALGIAFWTLLMAGGAPEAHAAGDMLPDLGGMLSPTIDPPGQPFSYFWHPTDILGTYLAPVATEVTPEGYLYNGFGDLMFFLGNPPEPVNQRIRTLYKGDLPIVQYEIERDQIRYRFTLFASDLGGALIRLPVNFVRVEACNLSAEPRTGFISSAYRFAAPSSTWGGRPDYRFDQSIGALPKRLTEGQVAFDPAWKYALADDSLQRNGRVLYLFPTAPAPYQESLSLGSRAQAGVRFFSGQVHMGAVAASSPDPKMPLGYVTYRLRLEPGARQSVDFKYPVVPLPEGSPEIAQVRAATYDGEFEKVARFWEEQVVAKIPLEFPEEKVQQALVANTAYTLLALNQVGDNLIPVCNKFQYNGHPMGYVTSHIVAALAEMGYQDLAKQGSLYDLKLQSPNGQWGNGSYWGYFGENAITWGRLYALTKDPQYLAQVFPALMKGAHRIAEVVRADPKGVLPPITLEDDEMLQGARFTGQNIRTLQGLLYAIEMAQAMHASADEAFLKEFYAEYRASFDRILETQTRQTGGYVPPALDVTIQGNDWDNLQLLYPQPLFDPFDARVSATIRQTRSRYHEGILPYLIAFPVGKTPAGIEFNARSEIHYWQSFNNSFSALARGGPQDQRDAVQDLYAILLHTTSTHAPQEFGTLPWGTRDFSLTSNLTPMMATSARLLSFLRTMLVREDADKLCLLSAVSPAWLKPGKELHVRNLATSFGTTSLSVKPDDAGWTVQLENQFRTPPREIVLRIPWFIDAKGIEADGKPLPIPTAVSDRPREISLPPGVRTIKIEGTTDPAWAEAFSYEAMVAQYKAAYARAYAQFLKTGEVECRPDAEIGFGLKAP
jgi:hypothetical protein